MPESPEERQARKERLRRLAQEYAGGHRSDSLVPGRRASTDDEQRKARREAMKARASEYENGRPRDGGIRLIPPRRAS